MNRFLILSIAFFCLTSQICAAVPIRQSRHNVDAAIWTAVSYCVDLRGEPTHFCIAPGAGGIDSRLLRNLRHLGTKVVSAKWIETAKLSGSMMYLEVSDFTWISRRRAKVQIYIAEPLSAESGRRLETVGPLYVELVGSRWVVDERSGGLRSIS